MIALLTVVIFVLSVVVNGESDPFDKCVELFNPKNIEVQCCDSMFMNGEVWASCEKEPVKDDCSKPNCMMKKLGFLDMNMKVNETAAAKALDQMMMKSPEHKPMAQRVKLFCLDEQYDDYAPVDNVCDSIKFMICTYVNSMVECKKWKKTDNCMMMEKVTKECKKAMDGAMR